MTDRKSFEMTPDQLAELLSHMKPVPLIALQCGTPSSPQENANRAWDRLGEEMGFVGSTVEPTGNGDRVFTAVPARGNPKK